MHPKLLEIPNIPLTLWSFGAMMALGLLLGAAVVRRLSRSPLWGDAFYLGVSPR